MQHPVGAEYNPETGRAEMKNIWEVLGNNTTLVAFPHVITTAFLVAGGFVAGIAAFWLVKKTRANPDDADISLYRTALRFGAATMIVAGIGVVITGDIQAKLMFEQQPIKMAAAEGLVETETGAPFSLLTIGNLAGDDPESVKHILAIPGFTSYLATGDFDAEVKGLNQLQEEYAAKYDADGTYRPNLAVTYWSFRLMIGFAAFAAATALAALWLTRKGRSTDKPWFSKLALYSIAGPYLGASFGWIFTEMGRQPFVVAPNPNFVGSDPIYLMTEFGVSKAVSAWEVGLTMVVFTLIYAILGVFWYRLMARYAQEGAPQVTEPVVSDDADQPLSFAY
jgi:cytochrome d ubiquinol oxidase subunit I